ncbi:hypothetical protein [Nocardioides speluncae]|uniref:hypothetical protein n=1 Tax=Nocardioides speluncae TaxID=2670337 RepID=UPI0012B1785E|nr:hypothetical protein [Nocardioides speluncae]
METIVVVIALFAFAALLIRYGRHDHFAGPGNVVGRHDELGSLTDRSRLVHRSKLA